METVNKEMQKKFDEGVVEALWSENGQLNYIVKDGINLEEFALVVKTVLEENGEIAHDFSGKLTNESKTATARFEYKSGWFLDGIANGEIE